MPAKETIAQNIDEVVAAFQKGRQISEAENSIDALIEKLNKTESAFPSVLFEGASSEIAHKIFADKSDFSHWQNFVQKIEIAHKAQVYVGLGWALAENGRNPNSVFSEIEALMQGRILDGFGYYHGLLRRRRFVKAAAIPENISDEKRSAFDQGIGRSIWYASKGDLVLLQKMLEAFDASRKTGLWRGIGVAAFYVGGMDLELLSRLRDISKPFQTAFLAGATLAARAKVMTQTLSQEDEKIFENGLGINADKAAEWSISSEKQILDPNSENSYFQWLEKIEANFQ